MCEGKNLKTIDILEDIGVITLYARSENTLYMIGVDAPSFISAVRKVRSAYLTLADETDQETLNGINLSAPVEAYKVINLDVAETYQVAYEGIPKCLWNLITKEQVFFSSYSDFEDLTSSLFSRVSAFIPDATLRMVYARDGYAIFEIELSGGGKPDFKIRGVVTSEALSRVIFLDKDSVQNVPSAQPLEESTSEETP